MGLLKTRTFLVMAIILLSGWSSASSNPPIATPDKSSNFSQRISIQEKAESIKDQRVIQQSSLIENIPPERKVETISERQSEKDDGKFVPEWLTAWATIFLAVITLFLALFTAWLWRATNRLVEGSERTAKTQLRAYVAPDRGYFRVAKNSLRAEIEIRNTGLTMAKEVSIQVHFFPEWRHIVSKGNNVYVTTTQERPGKGLFMPKAVWGFHQDIELSDEELDRIRYGIDKITVTGTIGYVDMFDVPRRTIFNFVNGKIDLGEDGSIAGWNIEAAQEGNDAT